MATIEGIDIPKYGNLPVPESPVRLMPREEPKPMKKPKRKRNTVRLDPDVPNTTEDKNNMRFDQLERRVQTLENRLARDEVQFGIENLGR